MRHDHQLHHEERYRSGAGPEDCAREQGLANGDLSPGYAGRAGWYGAQLHQRNISGVPQQRGYEASIDGLGEGRGMSVKRYEVNGPSSVFEDENGSLVDYEDYASLEARCAALAAENGVLLAIMNEQAGSFGATLAEGFHDAVMESGSDQLIDIYQRRLQQAIQCIPPTTSTDAFLAELRAQGVEMFAKEMHADISGDDAREFAAQLRKGVQS